MTRKNNTKIYSKITSLLLMFILLAMPMEAAAAEPEGIELQQPASEDYSEIDESNADPDRLLVLTDEGTKTSELRKISKEAGGILEKTNDLEDGTKLVSIKLKTDSIEEAADNLESKDSVICVQPNYRYNIDTVEEESVEAEPETQNAEPEDEEKTDDQAAAETDQETVQETSESAAEPENISETEVSSKQTGETYSNQSDNTSDLWYLYGRNKFAGGANILRAQRETSGNRIVRVAVIDTGADLDHPDLKNAILTKKCVTFNNGKQGKFNQWDRSYDDNGHGTHVSGLIAAKSAKKTGMNGAASEHVKLICIDASLPNSNSFTTQDMILGINYAVKNGAKIINMSLGGEYRDNLLDRTIQNAWNNGTICICAAGNAGSSEYISPSDSPKAISVMAHDKNGKRISQSNYGTDKDVSAPGSEIYSTWKDKTYAVRKGTSMAAPLVSAEAALLLANDPSLSPAALKNMILTSGRKGYFSAADSGFGMIDAAEGVSAARKKTEKPEYIVLNRDSAAIYTGSRININAAVYPIEASAYASDISFTSADTSVATVDNDGNVVGVKAGNTVITVKCRNIKKSVPIEVKSIPYKSVKSYSYKTNGNLNSGDPLVSAKITDDFDWISYFDGYKVPLKAKETIKIKISSKDILPCFIIYDSNGNAVLYKTCKESDAQKSLQGSYKAKKAGNYRVVILVSPESQINHGSYSLTITKSHQHKLKKVNAVAASCDKAGMKAHYECSICHNKYKDKNGKKTVTTEQLTITPHHNWSSPVYSWSDDNTEVTAKRICKNNKSHKETETVGTTSDSGKRDPEKITYVTNEFKNPAFKRQVRAVSVKSDFSSPSYKWSSDYTTLTATRTSLTDPSVTESETVSVTKKKISSASCTKKGKIKYTSAAFRNKAFKAQSKTVKTKALGHKWSGPIYTWSKNRTKVKATRYCKRNSKHYESETVGVTVTTSGGSLIYTSEEFRNPAFKVQTRKVKGAAETASDETEEENSDVLLDKSIPDIIGLKDIRSGKSALIYWTGNSRSELENIDKIEIQYSTDKRFESRSTKTLYVNKTKRYTRLKALDKEADYRVRIRNIKYIKGKMHVSRWRTRVI